MTKVKSVCTGTYWWPLEKFVVLTPVRTGWRWVLVTDVVLLCPITTMAPKSAVVVRANCGTLIECITRVFVWIHVLRNVDMRVYCVSAGVLQDGRSRQCCGGELVSGDLVCCGDDLVGAAYTGDASNTCCGFDYVPAATSVCCNDPLLGVRVCTFLFLRVTILLAICERTVALSVL